MVLNILQISILKYKCLNVLPIYICSCILVLFAKILESEESRVWTMCTCTSGKNGLRFAILRFHYESAQLKIVKMTLNWWLTVKKQRYPALQKAVRSFFPEFCDALSRLQSAVVSLYAIFSTFYGQLKSVPNQHKF